MVTSATTKPPKTPPVIHGTATGGAGECDRPQVHAAVATTQSRRKPVLLTVPCSVIASPKATCPLKAFSLSAGLEVRIRFAMDVSLFASKYQSTPSWTQFKTNRSSMSGVLSLLCVHRLFGFGDRKSVV